MDFSFMKQYYPFFIDGAKVTILLSLFTIIFGIIIGVLVALLRISKNKIFKAIATVYIEFIRGTPILVQLFIVYYGLPQLGIDFSDIPVIGEDYGDLIAAIVALSINSGAYIAEIVRAGINAVDKGQIEASSSLGMNYGLTMRYVVLPQAVRNILPALVNEFITLIKESAIVSMIGIHDLMYNAETIRGNTFKPFEPLLVVAMIYFIITFSLSKGMYVLERRMNRC
ncbi:amino acid ABC transporter permease [Clostridiaceae bacterium M8S5]|nr:amino acid ABC transporter permease [Clostridiaceae bacterium M8S5]